MRNIAIMAAFLAFAGACKPKTPEPVPQPKAGDPAAAADAAAPVRDGQKGGLLSAPGNYVRTTVGQVEKAKAAKALFEKNEDARLKELDLAGGGK